MPDPISGFFSPSTATAASYSDALVDNGWIPDTLIVKVTARVAVTAGYVYQFDITGSDADVTAGVGPGSTDSPFANIIDTTTTNNKTRHVGLCCIATEDIADNAQGLVLLRGFYEGAQVETTVAEGHGLSAESNNKFHECTTQSRKLVGVAMTTGSGGTCTVYFDGINGVGSVR